ncbi:triphosphoribosyl-dephospho-CoA synthase [Veillonella sp. LMAG:2]|uniref:triphosphoribosyl-dephospho-CoA synthase n=1 Tax=Veillonella sp. LMAG:2 TaxID=1969164 RepID=UPI0025E74576|nr:triphosphoribosyl-dephospho-CoA synthase [Veillonella sp. LMAG:2]
MNGCIINTASGGIRGELEDGLPIIKDIALPAYKKAITLGATDDNIDLYLIIIMTATEDTTIKIGIIWKH